MVRNKNQFSTTNARPCSSVVELLHGKEGTEVQFLARAPKRRVGNAIIGYDDYNLGMNSRTYGTIKCLTCGSKVVTTSNNQKYCVECGIANRKAKEKDYVRKPVDVEQRKKYWRDYYSKNREVLVRQTYLRTRQRRTRLLAIVAELKEGPCVDCGRRYPQEVMEFDHVRGKKEFDVANMVGKGLALSRILSEIKKCELVCANCHRVRTASRRT